MLPFFPGIGIVSQWLNWHCLMKTGASRIWWTVCAGIHPQKHDFLADQVHGWYSTLKNISALTVLLVVFTLIFTILMQSPFYYLIAFIWWIQWLTSKLTFKSRVQATFPGSLQQEKKLGNYYNLLISKVFQSSFTSANNLYSKSNIG